jgi:hypothetical protein
VKQVKMNGYKVSERASKQTTKCQSVQVRAPKIIVRVIHRDRKALGPG